MAEVNVMQAGNLLNIGTNKSDPTPVASREEKNTKSVNTLDNVEMTPAGKKTSSQEAASQVASSDMDVLVENLNAQLEKLNNYLRFEKDEDTEKMVIMIKDSETNEVIRQIPSEAFLEISRNISEYLEANKKFNQNSFPPGLITNEQV